MVSPIIAFGTAFILWGIWAATVLMILAMQSKRSAAQTKEHYGDAGTNEADPECDPPCQPGHAAP